MNTFIFIISLISSALSPTSATTNSTENQVDVVEELKLSKEETAALKELALESFGHRARWADLSSIAISGEHGTRHADVLLDSCAGDWVVSFVESESGWTHLAIEPVAQPLI